MKNQGASPIKNPDRWLVLAVGIASIVILVWAFLPGGTRAQPGFYQTAAQIIPVLILALAVEQLWGGWTLPYRAVVLVPLVAGEIAALSAAALATQKAKGDDYLVHCSAKIVDWGSASCSRILTDLLGAITAISLIVGLVAVLLNTLAVQPHDAQPAARDCGKPT